MPNPHFDISIVQRSKGKSSVAGAAYQSGEKLFSEYDQTYKDYRNKHGIVYTEILLPSNAPPEYADRATLWNAAEEVEKQWNSQLARRFVLALPREIPSELYPQMVRDYCEEHFVSKGMCCDFAIHDPHPPGHNPHCHVMLTMRAMDERGKWLPKTRKVYDLDENGERIRLPSGNWKSHKEDTVDWNEQYHGEEWRHGWEVVQNRYLEMVGSPERVDLRSYERQGLDIIPTVHMGPAVTQMERRGIETNIGNLNRDIKAANRMMSAIRKTISSLRDWITDVLEAGKEAFAELEAQKASPNLGQLLGDYLNLRKAERSEWSRYGQQKGTAEDLKAVSQALIYLKEHNLCTLEDLDTALQGKCLGMLEAVGEVFPEAKYQRCVVHFYRNVFSVVPKSKVKNVAKMLKAIHAQESKKASREKAAAVVAELKAMKLPEAAKKVADGIEETLTYCDFPSEHWTKIRTNNVIERMNREIRRRTRVVGAFPDGNSALMLVCARLRHVAGTQWGSKKYMNMKHLEVMEQETLEG